MSRLSMSNSQTQTTRPKTNQSNYQKSSPGQVFNSTHSESTLLQQHQSNHKKSLKERYLKQKELSSQLIDSQVMNKSRNNTSKLLTRLASEMIIQNPNSSIQNQETQKNNTPDDLSQKGTFQSHAKSRISVNNLYKTLNQNQQNLQQSNLTHSSLTERASNKNEKINTHTEIEVDINLQYSPIQKQVYFKNIDKSLAKRQSCDHESSKSNSKDNIQRQAQEFFGKTYQENLNQVKQDSNHHSAREVVSQISRQDLLHDEVYNGQMQHSPGSKFKEDFSRNSQHQQSVNNRSSKIRSVLQNQYDGKRSQSENPRLETQFSTVQQNINDIGLNSVHQSKYNYYQALVIQNKKQKQKNFDGKCLSARTMSVQSAGLVRNMNKQASAISLQSILPNHEPPKQSSKRNGIVRAYAASTNQGIYRSYNEDRVSIILNIVRPSNKRNKRNGNADTPTRWPTCSFFGVFDGHGGNLCADFLRDNLHHYIVRDENFPSNPREAIKRGFAEAEKFFIEYAMTVNLPDGQAAPTQEDLDKSGSCGIITLIVDDVVYVANVGDSRAILSANSGQKIYCLSRDHKPGDPSEKQRIIDHGGKIYQSQIPVKIPMLNSGSLLNKQAQQHQLGPMRVFPGRLSVSRTFGDIEAKLRQFGGVPNVISAEPEIRQFKLSQGEHDFIIMGCDGIFDKLTNKEIIDLVWANINQKLDGKENQLKDKKADDSYKIALDPHQECSEAVELILQESVKKKTLDNITVVMICFKNFSRDQKLQKSPQLDLTTPQEEIKDSRNKIEYREHQRQVQTEALNSAATSRQQSEDSQKSKLTLTAQSPSQNSQKHQSSSSSSKMNYFILSKGKLTARNQRDSDKYEALSQSNSQKLQIDKVLQKYDNKVSQAALTGRSGANCNQPSANIGDIQKKTLLFKKSIDEQKQKNLYQMLKQKQAAEGINQFKSNMFEIQEKTGNSQNKEGINKFSGEQQPKVKPTLLLKNYPVINSSRSTNSNGSNKDYENANVATPKKRNSLNPGKIILQQKQKTAQDNSPYMNKNMFTPKSSNSIGNSSNSGSSNILPSNNVLKLDSNTQQTIISRQLSDRQFSSKQKRQN